MSNSNGASFLVFSRDEYAERLARARSIMQENQLDAMLLTAWPNVLYMTGYRSSLFNSSFRPLQALIPVDSDPVLILPDLEVGSAIETSPYQDIRGWGNTANVVAPDAITAVRDVINEKNLSSGRIGIELGTNMRLGLGLDQYDQLMAATPGVEWANSAPLLWRLRRVKSPAEVEYVRESQRILDAAYHAVLDFAKAGVTERDLLRVLGRTMMDEGADNPQTQNFQSGPLRYKMANPTATSRKLESGDMVIIDMGAAYQMYKSDITRGFFIDRVSDRQRELYDASVSITAETVKAIRPGMTCAQLDAVAEKQIDEHGYRDLVLHRTGHSIGIETHEMPSIGPADHTVLEPGMILTVEPALYDFDEGCFRMEDMVLVTESGYEYLSHANRDLVVK